jgi:GxxExxY protein
MSFLYKNETFKIIGLCMEVHKNLGPGFLEIVYKEALFHEFKTHNIEFDREKEIKVEYKGTTLDHAFYADFVINNKIILELKSVKNIDEVHIAQTINYLKTSKLKVGLLVNFGEKSLFYKRLVL